VPSADERQRQAQAVCEGQQCPPLRRPGVEPQTEHRGQGRADTRRLAGIASSGEPTANVTVGVSDQVSYPPYLVVSPPSVTDRVGDAANTASTKDRSRSFAPHRPAHPPPQRRRKVRYGQRRAGKDCDGREQGGPDEEEYSGLCAGCGDRYRRSGHRRGAGRCAVHPPAPCRLPIDDVFHDARYGRYGERRQRSRWPFPAHPSVADRSKGEPGSRVTTRLGQGLRWSCGRRCRGHSQGRPTVGAGRVGGMALVPRPVRDRCRGMTGRGGQRERRRSR